MESGGTHTELHTYTLTHRHTHTDTHAQKGRNARGCSSSQLLFPLIFWYLFTFFPRSFHFFLDSLKASDVSYGFYRIVLTFFCHYSWFWGAVSMLFEAILRGSGLIFRIFWDSFGFYDVSNGFLDTSYELIRCLMAIILGFGGCFDAFWGDPSRLRAHFWDLLGSYEFLERISQLFLWLFWDLCAAFPSF